MLFVRWNEDGGDWIPSRRIVPSICISPPRSRSRRIAGQMWNVIPNALLQSLAAIVAMVVNRRAGSLAIFITTCAILGFTIMALLWSNRRPR